MPHYTMTSFKLTKRMRDTGNAPYVARANMKLAAEIRAFRPDPVAQYSDKQLVWRVATARDAARELGITDPVLIKRWIMTDALLMPGFFAAPGVRAHFQAAFGDPDAKAGDVLQQIKIIFFDKGHGAQIWW